MFKQLLLATALMTSVSAFAKAEKIEVDPATSKIVWLGTKVGGQHTGEIKIQSGHLNFDGAAFKGAEFVVDADSITVTDITDAKKNSDLVGHLKSDDFFSTATHKTAKFVSTGVKKVKGDTYSVTGNLTIKETTKPVTFDATVTKTASSAVVVFDRSLYNVKYNSPKFFPNLGDKLINDNIQLTVTLNAKK